MDLTHRWTVSRAYRPVTACALYYSHVCRLPLRCVRDDLFYRFM